MEIKQVIANSIVEKASRIDIQQHKNLSQLKDIQREQAGKIEEDVLKYTEQH